MDETLYRAAALIVPLIIAIVFHEVAHGYVARMLGDHTAAKRGRLTLNPVRHVDPVGTVVLPGMLALTGLPVFGWAKPVPVVPGRLRNPRRDMMIVAAAGPMTNLVLAAAGALGLGLLLGALAASGGGSGEVSTVARFVALNLVNFVTINVFLALFNLLPIPPFDGSHIVEGLLPERAAARFARVRHLGFVLVLILLIALPALIPGFDPVGKVVSPPVQWLVGHYFQLAGLIAGVPA